MRGMEEMRRWCVATYWQVMVDRGDSTYLVRDKTVEALQDETGLTSRTYRTIEESIIHQVEAL